MNRNELYTSLACAFAVLLLLSAPFLTCAHTKQMKIAAIRAGATPAEAACLIETERTSSEMLVCEKVFTRATRE